MARYHVNLKGNGKPGICSAAEGNCPFGKETPHYKTAIEARKGYEEAMRSQTVPTLKKIKKPFKKWATIGGVGVVAVSLAGCDSIQKVTEDAGSNTSITGENQSQQSSKGIYFQGKPLSVPASKVAEAKKELKSLKIAASDTGAYYNRAGQFGRSFETGVVGRMEHRDITNGVFKNSAPQSRAIGGSFVDPYTGKTVQIVKGSSTDTDVDHVVPLQNAVEHGAGQWSQVERLKFANDPNNLAIVSSAANRQKGDSDASEWVPSYKPAECSYVVAQITVKDTYDLTVTSAEEKAMEFVLNNRCS